MSHAIPFILYEMKIYHQNTHFAMWAIYQRVNLKLLFIYGFFASENLHLFWGLSFSGDMRILCIGELELETLCV